MDSFLVESRLEREMCQAIFPFVNQKVMLRRFEIMLNVGDLLWTHNDELFEPLYEATDSNIIETWQECRIVCTDLIVRARRQFDKSVIWIAAEASSTIQRQDIEDARQSADTLATVFKQEAIAVVAGYRISSEQAQQADDADVEVLIVT